MIKIMARKGNLTDIGYLGENEHRVICFHDSIELLKQYPDAGVTVLHKRSGDESAYPVPPQYVSIQNGIVEWTIQSGDLAVAGPGKCELVFTKNGVVAKTLIYDTVCKTSLDGAGDPPEPWEGWIEHVTQTAAQIAADKEATIEAANEAAAAKEETVTAKQAAVTAQAAAEGAKEIAARRASDAQSAALIAENKAQNATEAAERSTNMAWNAGQSAGNAQQNRLQAYTYALEAEGLTNGTKNGAPVESGSPYFENNAKYWAGKAGESAEQAAEAERNVETKLVAFLPEDTATGAVASFPDGADDLPVTELTVKIEPVQDLHGYDSPWPGGSTKNKMPNAIPKTETINGITFKLDDFGIFTVTGTATSEASCDFPIGFSFVILDGDPKPKLALNNTHGTPALFKFFNGSNQIDSWGITPANRVQEFSSMRGKTCNSYRIIVPSGVTLNMTISPMIVENSVTDYTYIPYSNICPITGWTGAKVTRTSGNQLRNNSFNSPAYGVSCTVQTDDCVAVLSGTATQTIGFTVAKCQVQTGATYTVSVENPNQNCVVNVRKMFDNTYVGMVRAFASSGTATFTVDETFNAIDVRPTVNNGVSVSNYVVKYSLAIGSTATAYEPYQGETYDIEFPTEAGTVYGGTLDVTTGVLTVDRAMVDVVVMGDNGILNDNQQMAFSAPGKKGGLANFASDKFTIKSGAYGMTGRAATAVIEFRIPLADLNVSASDTSAVRMEALRNWFADNPTKLVYELATPIAYQLTPQEVRTLLGDNNIWADTGDSTVTYKADIQRYIAKKIAAALA